MKVPFNFNKTKQSSLFTILFYLSISFTIWVYCDKEMDVSKWTDFFFWSQDGSIDFSCNWVEYEKGLCSLSEYFWLGLGKIHCLSPDGKNTLRVDIGDFSSYTAYAQYSEFKVLDTTDEYTMAISGYVGMAGDYFGAHDAMKFSTKDRDQGTDKNRNCAETFKGG